MSDANEPANKRAGDRARRIIERLAGSTEQLDKSAGRLDASRVAERLQQIEQLFLLHGGERSGNSGPDAESVLFEWGHLQVLEKLGEGSFGEVYRAYDRTLDRDVALKLLKTDQGRPFQSQLFLHEARQLAMVRHRHVLAVHGAAVHDGRPGLWTDLIDGMTAHDDSLRDSFQDHAATLELVESLALAVQAVHAAGLVHGDVKPSNLMRDASGEWILMDFGASRSARSGETGPSLTSGSPLYMAPEVVLGDTPDDRADRYSMGATLYRVLTGSPPFEIGTWEELRALHQNGRRPQPPDLPADAGGRVARLIGQLMGPDPDQRPGTDEFIAEVRAIRDAPHKRFRRIALGSICGVLIAGLLATSIGFYRANEARSQALIEQQNTLAVNQFLQRVLLTPSSSGSARDMTVEDMLTLAAADAEKALEGQDRARVVVHRVLADSFNVLRRPEMALEQIALARRTLADNDLAMVDEARNLDLEEIPAMELLGRHEESIELAERFVDANLDALGDDHLWIRWARNYQVTNLLSLSRYEDAEAILQAHFTEIPDPETAETHFGYEILQSWANVQNRLGRFDEAVATSERSLDWLDRFPGTRPINRAYALTNLALSLNRANRPDRALEVLTELEPLQARIFGTNSSDYIGTLTNLAAVQHDSGDLDAAGETLQSALKLIRETPGLISDRERLTVQVNLANIINASGDAQAAEDLMRETRRQAIELLGPLHQKVLTLEYNLIELLSQQERFDEAARLGEKTLERKREAFGDEHWLTLLGMDNLAVALAGLGRSDEPLALHDQALASLTEQLGSEHPFALLVERHRLATLQGFAPERIEPGALDALVQRHEDALGQDHPDTLKARALTGQTD